MWAGMWSEGGDVGGDVVGWRGGDATGRPGPATSRQLNAAARLPRALQCASPECATRPCHAPWNTHHHKAPHLAALLRISSAHMRGPPQHAAAAPCKLCSDQLTHIRSSLNCSCNHCHRTCPNSRSLSCRHSARCADCPPASSAVGHTGAISQPASRAANCWPTIYLPAACLPAQHATFDRTGAQNC